MGRLTVAFLCEPLGDLLARQAMVVVQMHDHRRQRQPLVAARRAPLRDLVEAPEQPFEMIGDQLAVIARQVIDAVVDRAERARAAPARRSSCRSTGARASIPPE